jgi:site-specific DNA recombinase
MTRAAIYVRVSTKRQGERGESLPEQIIACRAHADKHGYTVIGEPFEDMYTGNSLDRPALDELREFVKRERINVVVVYSMDRLSRTEHYQKLIKYEFASRYNTRIEYATQTFEDSPTGRFSETVISAAAELERELIRLRTNRDKRAKARKGAIITGDRAPYGYIVIRNSTTGYLELHIDEQARVIIVMIYDWYTSDLHCTIRDVRDRLEQMSIPSPMGNAHWSHNAVWRILSDEVYAGTWYYNKRMSVPSTTAKKKYRQPLRPKEEWIPVAVDAMVSREIFAIAQEKLTTNRHRVLRRHKQDYLFAGGHLSCQCGRHYVGKVIGTSGRFAYRCTRRNTGGACTTPYFYEDELDRKIWEWMTTTVTNIERVIQTLNDRQAAQELEHAPLIRRLKDIEALIAENRAAQKRWDDRYERGKMEEDEYDEKIGRLKSEMAGWERERAKVEAQLHAVVVYTTEEITNIVAYCDRISHGMPQMNRHERRETYELLNLQARLTVEGEWKIAYVTCVIAPREERLEVASVRRSSRQPSAARSSRACSGAGASLGWSSPAGKAAPRARHRPS